MKISSIKKAYISAAFVVSLIAAFSFGQTSAEIITFGAPGEFSVDPTSPDDFESAAGIHIGQTGFAAVEVNNGSDLTLGNANVIGSDNGDPDTPELGAGLLLVTGSGSTVSTTGQGETGCLFVGWVGTGSLIIQDGGVVNVGTAQFPDCVTVGQITGSTGVITVKNLGSQLIITDELLLGHGNPTTILEGCELCGTGNPGSGTLNVLDNAAVSIGQSLTVGNLGNSGGMLNIGDGGVVTVDENNGDIRVGNRDDAAGIINVGGTLNAPRIRAGNSGNSTGTVNISGVVNLRGGSSQSLVKVLAPQAPSTYRALVPSLTFRALSLAPVRG